MHVEAAPGDRRAQAAGSASRPARCRRARRQGGGWPRTGPGPRACPRLAEPFLGEPGPNPCRGDAADGPIDVGVCCGDAHACHGLVSQSVRFTRGPRTRSSGSAVLRQRSSRGSPCRPSPSFVDHAGEDHRGAEASIGNARPWRGRDGTKCSARDGGFSRSAFRGAFRRAKARSGRLAGSSTGPACWPLRGRAAVEAADVGAHLERSERRSGR